MDPYVGEIRIFAGPYAPQDWAFCDGTMLQVNDNQALFALIGNRYGGDGRTTFALPDMRGRLPVHQGAGTGLSPRALASSGGTETVTLTEAQMPAHSHMLMAMTSVAGNSQPQGNMLAKVSVPIYATEQGTPTVAMPADMVSAAGGGQSHNNLMPYLCLNYIIALKGIYPSQQ